MILDFLFWFFLAGVIIATIQDLKRREIDFWLCGIMLIGGIAFVVFSSIINQTILPILNLLIALIILFALKKIFYASRIFAGGDANLLFALSALFVGATYIATITNIATYIIILLFSGAVYGLASLTYLYVKNFKTTNKQMGPELRKIRYPLILGASIILMLLSAINPFLPTIGILLAIYPLLYIFSKTLEEGIMTKSLNPRDLQEGDWLAQDVKLKNKTIKYSWDGLSSKDIALLKKQKKKVKVKYGLPFAPAFLLAHILYWLVKDGLLKILGI